MSLSDCCVRGFQWDGEPTGQVINFPTSTGQAYVAGSNNDRAVLLIADLFGWKFVNNRLLADHFAQEANATVYVPDLYSLPPSPPRISLAYSNAALATKATHPKSSPTNPAGVSSTTSMASSNATAARSANPKSLPARRNCAPSTKKSAP
jgi:hypothetical protein